MTHNAACLNSLPPWPPSELGLSVPPTPPPYVHAVTYEKTLLHFHFFLLFIRIYLYYFYLQYCFVSKYLFRHNTLFTGTTKNVLKINGIVFGVFIVSDEYLCKFVNVRLRCGQLQAKIVSLQNLR